MLTNLSLGEKVAYGTIASLGILGNSLVIYVLTHMVRSRKGNTNVLIINQSIIDLATSVLLVLCFLTPEPSLPESHAAASILCSVWNSKYLFWATIISSTFNLVGLTLERFYAIVYPFRYHGCTLFIWPRSLLLAAAPWVLAYAYQAYYPAMHYVEDGRCQQRRFPNKAAQVVYATVILLVTYLIPIGIMTFAYIRIYSTMKTESISMIAAEKTTDCLEVEEAGQSRRNPNDHGNTQALRNIIKTLMLVYVVFGLCWAPNQICYFYFNVSGNEHLQETFYNITVCLAFFNICANPIVYTLKYRRFREGLQRAMPWLARLTRITDLKPIR